MARVLEGGKPLEGGAGEFTYYMRNGQLIARQRRNGPCKAKRSRGEVAQRSKWSNLVQAWKKLSPSISGLFERQKPGQTAYNLFMSLNLPLSTVHLTEEQSLFHQCVAEPFQVSSGTLTPAVEAVEEGEWVMSDVQFRDGQLSPEECFGLGCAAIFSPEGIHEGDELVFLRVRQKDLGHPVGPIIQVYSAVVELTQSNHLTLAETLRFGQIEEGFDLVDGRFAARREEGSYCGWVRRRRRKDGSYQVTSQRLVGSNPLLAEYSGEEALKKVLDSHKNLKPQDYLDKEAN